jgi:squalene-hopene/tetraprenyl-beta-curcumene cyclase
MAAFPRRWFAALRLPVVSYALPALIAIGQVRHVHAPGWRPWSWLREAAVGRTRRLLREIQPEGGGFLEATPLTGFVAMALCSAGAGNGEVVREALAFLERSVREDGSWPIDTNLATWGTTLSVKALGSDLPPGDREAVREWLLGQQYKVQHPYCLSAPGGWAWTDLPGGVPDADDTAGALLALRELAGPAEVVAAEAGARWLAGLQNEDGGMPTFCKGWGALPFDRSAADLTAHALAAWQVWREDLPMDLVPAMQRAVDWIEKTQRPDGAWLPLWFGNEHETDEANAVYGTATVLKYLCRLPVAGFPRLAGMREKAARFLTRVQQENGTWSGGPGGGAGSIEETAAAVEALVAFAGSGLETALAPSLGRGIEAGGIALLRLTEGGKQFPAAPIGLYFARLWYYEKLYPLTASVAAFRRLQEWLAARDR